MVGRGSTTETEDGELSIEPTARASAPPVQVDDTIGRYQVRRLIGKGGMSEVYLGRDLTLGRSVALKLVRASLRGEQESARILNEARAIAALNHPHIVQVYDFGEHAGRLYLALEYIEGVSLRDRAAAGTLSTDEVLRHALAIAEALEHAHAQGIYHCDLKQGNVMLGRDGRLRVVDFGLAQTTDVADLRVAGTPDWMAPEQWAGRGLTAAVDIWALAVIVTQLLTGEHPLGADESRRRRLREADERQTLELQIELQIDARALPAPVLELVTRSLQLDPGARPSATAWVHALRELVSGRLDALTEEGPYRGLSSFAESDARFYFGREAEVDAFLERLLEVPCLPIVGPSGAGKSSFLHAGVLPRLRLRETWTVLTLRPGAAPIASLARQVVVAASGAPLTEAELRAEAAALEEQLRETPTLLAARLATCAATHGSRVLLAVDQLEEVFTQGAGGDDAQRFLDMLLTTVDDRHDPVRVVCTLRDDFVGRIPQLRALFVMRQMSIDDLRRTIVAPLQRLKYSFDDPRVVEEMLEEITSGAVADLPLVQFACRALWDGRDVTRRELRRSTYAAIGGIAGALGRHAQAALAALTPDERRAARALLLQLVAGKTRRSVGRAQLVHDSREAEAVLDRLLAARLLVQHPRSGEDEPLVEIAHESLVTAWPELVRWLEETRDERRLLGELDDASSLWRRRGRRADETWSQPELQAARGRVAQLGLTLPPHVQEFLTAAEQRHRQVRRRRLITLVAVTAIASATAAAFVAVASRAQTREHKARNNFGRVLLTLQPFDYGPGAATVPVDAAELPDLRYSLFSADPNNEHEPGKPVPDAFVKVQRRGVRGGVRVDLVEAPGGLAFLKLEGRGRHGERCAPSWVRLLALPGYSTSADGDVRPIKLAVPTCQASRWDVVEIEAGPFVYGGPGELASPLYATPEGKDHTEPEKILTLPAFSIDRTEVSNAAFAPFLEMGDAMGYHGTPYYDDDMHKLDKEPERPVTAIDAPTAEAFCRFLGKRLPSDAQWVKAARGGLTVRGTPNLHPRRLYPWGIQDDPRCARLKRTDPQDTWVERVTDYADCASPYGVLQLVGNVEEWISRTGQSDWHSPLRALRGGTAESKPEYAHHTTIFRNHHPARYITYGIGVRCASEAP
ncbi:MAG: protein kinase [Kofleriaceae bacterium]